MAARHLSSATISHVDRSRTYARDAAVQISFEFPDATKHARTERRDLVEASSLITQALDRLCACGHSMCLESTVLMHAQSRSRLRRDQLLLGLQRAVRQRQIARESLDGQEWLFPRGLRDAEMTVARCVRQLAEGTPLARSDRARLEKVSLLCSSSSFAVVDVMRTTLIRLNRKNCWPTLLVQGATEAQWYRWRLGRPVLEMRDWLQTSGYRRSNAARTSDFPMIVVLDASRLGLETMAEFLEAISSDSALMLIGNPGEAPTSGHGQPFRDLVATTLFQCVRISTPPGRVESAPSPAPMRRSALCWRLRRGAGLSSHLRWGPIATIETESPLPEAGHDLRR
jgi:hypothetical protein